MQRSGVQRAESSASAKTWNQEKGETNGGGYEWAGGWQGSGGGGSSSPEF